MTDTVVCRHSSYLLYIYPVPSCIASQSIDKSASFPLLYRSSCCAHVILDSLWSNVTSRLKCRAMNSYQRWHRLQTWLHLRFEIIEIHRSQCIYQCISVPILDVYKMMFIICTMYTVYMKITSISYYILYWCYAVYTHLFGSNHHFSSGLMLHLGSTRQPWILRTFPCWKLGWDSRLPPEVLLMDRSKACVQHKGNRIIQFTPRAPAQTPLSSAGLHTPSSSLEIE